MLSAQRGGRAAEDARGVARARGVRARDHRPAEGRAHHPVAHAALRVHALHRRRDPRAPRRRRARRKASRPIPKRWRSSLAPAAGSMRDSLSLLDQAIAHGALDVEQVSRSFGGTAFAGRARDRCRASPTKTSPARSSGWVSCSTPGTSRAGSPKTSSRRSRDAFLLTSAKGQVRVDVPEDDVGAARRARRPASGPRDARAHARDARPGRRRHARRRRRRSRGSCSRSRWCAWPAAMPGRRCRRSPSASTGSNAARRRRRHRRAAAPAPPRRRRPRRRAPAPESAPRGLGSQSGARSPSSSAIAPPGSGRPSRRNRQPIRNLRRPRPPSRRRPRLRRWARSTSTT